MFINYRNIDSHNAHINEILGLRDSGKTYGLIEKILKMCLKKNGKFIYLLRRPVDIDDVLQSGTNPLNKVAEDKSNPLYSKLHKDGKSLLEVKRKGFYLDGEHIGYFFALSKALRLKRLPYDDVKIVMFDEFLIKEDDGESYLENEPYYFDTFVDTVLRLRDDTKFYLLGNALTFYNPYNIYWGIKHPNKTGKTELYRNGEVSLTIYAPKDFIEFRKNTVVGKMIDGSAYGEMSLYNKFDGFNSNFICKREQGCKYLCGIVLSNFIVGVYIGKERLYVSETYERESELFCLSRLTFKKGYTLINKNIRNTPLEIITELYRQGFVFFENEKVQDVFNEFLTKFI